MVVICLSVCRLYACLFCATLSLSLFVSMSCVLIMLHMSLSKIVFYQSLFTLVFLSMYIAFIICLCISWFIFSLPSHNSSTYLCVCHISTYVFYLSVCASLPTYLPTFGLCPSNVNVRDFCTLLNIRWVIMFESLCWVFILVNECSFHIDYVTWLFNSLLDASCSLPISASVNASTICYRQFSYVTFAGLGPLLLKA